MRFRLILLAALVAPPARGGDVPSPLEDAPRKEEKAAPGSARPPAEPASKEPASKKQPAPKKTGAKLKGAAEKDAKEAPKPPRRVQLPDTGEYEAIDLLPLAGALHGLAVEADGRKVEETLVKIPPELAGQRVGREEMAILLGAHGIYLFLHERAEGPILIATRDSRWTPARDVPRHFRKFQVRSKDFAAVAKEVEAYLAERNRGAPPGQPLAAALCDGRTKTIIVRASTKRVLAGVDELMARIDRPDVDALHLYTYRPRHRRAEELADEVLEAMGEAEAKGISLVSSHRGNLLLIRAREEVYRKLLTLLESHDAPESGPQD